MEVQALHKFDNARFPVCDINYASILGISAVDLRDQMIKVCEPNYIYLVYYIAQNIWHATPPEAKFSVCLFALEKATNMNL